jgi:2-amino-4-hydroxy-6-hydroxymethyldihydropteridine diphosphokinase
MARVFISVGSNIQPEANVRRALELLGQRVHVVGISTFYHTEPVGRPEHPQFVNGIVEIDTDIAPRELKDGVLERIEAQLDRRRTDDKYAPRTIDLDVIIYGDREVNSDDLVLPDPNIAHRAFLAIPLSELAPDLALPGSGVRIREIAERLRNHGMEPMLEYTELLRRGVEDEPRSG